MDYFSSVQRGVDYIEANLHFDVGMSDVARHAGISSWHFQRIFKALTNETLKTYIRSRRFAHALVSLEHKHERILEIALAAGFRSQESFTRAFRRAFGITPAQYRRSPGSVPLPRKVRFDRDYLYHLQSRVTLEPEIVQLPALRLVGMRTRLYGPESEKNNMGRKLPKLWADFLPRIDEVPQRIDSGDGYGVLQQTDAPTGELTYWAAVPVTAGASPAPGMRALDLAPARYARFTHRGNIRDLDHTVNYIYFQLAAALRRPPHLRLGPGALQRAVPAALRRFCDVLPHSYCRRKPMELTLKHFAPNGCFFSSPGSCHF